MDKVAPETKEQLESALEEIRSWEREQLGTSILDRVGRLPFLVIDRLTPRFIRDKIGHMLDEIGNFVQHGGKYLISERRILDRLAKARLESPAAEETQLVPLAMEDAAELPLAVMNRVASSLADSRSNAAMLQGATTGIGGFATLAVDIPAVLALSLKIIQETAVCYGYDPKRKEERLFAVKCLQFASADAVGRKAVLDALAAAPGAREGSVSELQGWREVVAAYRDRFGWKKLFQAVPIAGMAFGAFINKGTISEVAEAAQMLYRKRRILERLYKRD